MAKKTAPLLPSTDELLAQLGQRLRVARLRRKLPAKQLAERSGMSPMTLRSIERGGSGVTIGAYLAVMQVLGIEKDLSLLAKADPLGRELQDARLPAQRSSTPRQTLYAQPEAQEALMVAEARKPVQRNESGADWIASGGFASTGSLADLIKPAAAPLKKRR
jgi:transcriptional regulator with XRE-family HTH domain